MVEEGRVVGGSAMVLFVCFYAAASCQPQENRDAMIKKAQGIGSMVSERKFQFNRRIPEQVSINSTPCSPAWRSWRLSFKMKMGRRLGLIGVDGN